MAASGLTGSAAALADFVGRTRHANRDVRCRAVERIHEKLRLGLVSIETLSESEPLADGLLCFLALAAQHRTQGPEAGQLAEAQAAGRAAELLAEIARDPVGAGVLIRTGAVRRVDELRSRLPGHLQPLLAAVLDFLVDGSARSKGAALLAPSAAAAPPQPAQPQAQQQQQSETAAHSVARVPAPRSRDPWALGAPAAGLRPRQQRSERELSELRALLSHANPALAADGARELRRLLLWHVPAAVWLEEGSVLSALAEALPVTAQRMAQLGAPAPSDDEEQLGVLLDCAAAAADGARDAAAANPELAEPAALAGALLCRGLGRALPAAAQQQQRAAALLLRIAPRLSERAAGQEAELRHAAIDAAAQAAAAALAALGAEGAEGGSPAADPRAALLLRALAALLGLAHDCGAPLPEAVTAADPAGAVLATVCAGDKAHAASLIRREPSLYSDLRALRDGSAGERPAPATALPHRERSAQPPACAERALAALRQAQEHGALLAATGDIAACAAAAPRDVAAALAHDGAAAGLCESLRRFFTAPPAGPLDARCVTAAAECLALLLRRGLVPPRGLTDAAALCSSAALPILFGRIDIAGGGGATVTEAPARDDADLDTCGEALRSYADTFPATACAILLLADAALCALCEAGELSEALDFAVGSRLLHRVWIAFVRPCTRAPPAVPCRGAVDWLLLRHLPPRLADPCAAALRVAQTLLARAALPLPAAPAHDALAESAHPLLLSCFDFVRCNPPPHAPAAAAAAADGGAEPVFRRALSVAALSAALLHRCGIGWAPGAGADALASPLVQVCPRHHFALLAAAVPQGAAGAEHAARLLRQYPAAPHHAVGACLTPAPASAEAAAFIAALIGALPETAAEDEGGLTLSDLSGSPPPEVPEAAALRGTLAETLCPRLFDALPHHLPREGAAPPAGCHGLTALLCLLTELVERGSAADHPVLLGSQRPGTYTTVWLPLLEWAAGAVERLWHCATPAPPAPEPSCGAELAQCAAARRGAALRCADTAGCCTALLRLLVAVSAQDGVLLRAIVQRAPAVRFACAALSAAAGSSAEAELDKVARLPRWAARDRAAESAADAAVCAAARAAGYLLCNAVGDGVCRRAALGQLAPPPPEGDPRYRSPLVQLLAACWELLGPGRPPRQRLAPACHLLATLLRSAPAVCADALAAPLCAGGGEALGPALGARLADLRLGPAAGALSSAELRACDVATGSVTALSSEAKASAALSGSARRWVRDLAAAARGVAPSDPQRRQLPELPRGIQPTLALVHNLFHRWPAELPADDGGGDEDALEEAAARARGREDRSGTRADGRRPRGASWAAAAAGALTDLVSALAPAAAQPRAQRHCTVLAAVLRCAHSALAAPAAPPGAKRELYTACCAVLLAYCDAPEPASDGDALRRLPCMACDEQVLIEGWGCFSAAGTDASLLALLPTRGREQLRQLCSKVLWVYSAAKAKQRAAAVLCSLAAAAQADPGRQLVASIDGGWELLCAKLPRFAPLPALLLLRNAAALRRSKAQLARCAAFAALMRDTLCLPEVTGETARQKWLAASCLWTVVYDDEKAKALLKGALPAPGLEHVLQQLRLQLELAQGAAERARRAAGADREDAQGDHEESGTAELLAGAVHSLEKALALVR